MFAANLSAVVRGEAHQVYQDPDLFFANTYPTERVRSFVREVAGRLSGGTRQLQPSSGSTRRSAVARPTR